MQKKGFELSLNFIVVLIISIVVLVGGITLTQQFLKTIGKQEVTIDAQTKRQIESLLIDGHQVAIPIDQTRLAKGDSTTFGLGVYNTLSNGITEFRVAVSFARAYDPLNREMDPVENPPAPSSPTYINENWVFGRTDSEFDIETNEYKLIPLAVTVDGNMDTSLNTRAGTYEFNVCVCPCDPADLDEPCYESDHHYCQNLCMDPNSYRDNIYGKHVMKLYVIVSE